jgi:hypothetical protein
MSAREGETFEAIVWRMRLWLLLAHERAAASARSMRADEAAGRDELRRLEGGRPPRRRKKSA